jgi:hypothetical protein
VREESRREVVGTLDMAYSTLPSTSSFFPRVCDAKRAEDVGEGTAQLL